MSAEVKGDIQAELILSHIREGQSLSGQANREFNEAFVLLREHYLQEVWSCCLALLPGNERHLAQDIVQVVFLGAWKQLPQFRGKHGAASLKAWLYRIASNACLEVYRRKSREESSRNAIEQSSSPRE